MAEPGCVFYFQKNRIHHERVRPGSAKPPGFKAWRPWVSRLKGRTGVKVLRKIPDIFGAASAGLIFLIWLMMTVEVAARNIFSSPILGVSEIGIYLYVTAVYFGFSYTQKHKGHIAVELLYDQLGPRVKKIVDLLVCLLSDILFISFTFCVWKSFAESWAIKEIYLSAMKMPVYLLKFTIALGISVMLLQLLIDTVDAARAVFQPGRAGAAPGELS